MDYYNGGKILKLSSSLSGLPNFDLFLDSLLTVQVPTFDDGSGFLNASHTYSKYAQIKWR